MPNYWFNFKRDPKSVEPSAEDIKCELQLQALGDFEALHMPFDSSLFTSQTLKAIKTYQKLMKFT